MPIPFRPTTSKFIIVVLLLVTAVAGGNQLWLWAQPRLDFLDPNNPFQIQILAEGLEHPWGMAFLPDGRLLITERTGHLRLVDKDWQLRPEPVAGLPSISVGGQGGLLDVALHPQFDAEPWVYLSYVAGEEGQVSTEVARGRWQNDQLVDTQVIFRLLPKSGTRHHFGSRLVFDKKGYLYITLGDRGNRPRAQDLNDHAGSVIRLLPDGRIPKDNPFIGRPDAQPAIYSYGHRNIQGATISPATGALWIHEHGPQGGDEINIVRPGLNYGWPDVTYGKEYGSGISIGVKQKPGVVQPIHYWDPSIAPSGMAFYQGNTFPDWQGDLLVGALKYQLLVRLELKGDRVIKEHRYLQGQLGRIRAVKVGPDDAIYLLTDAATGRLVRLTNTRN